MTIPSLLKQTTLWLATATLLTGATACGSTSGATRGGNGAASFEATDLEGEAVDLAEHLGKDVVLLSFWATYCEPCKAEMPLLQGMHERFESEGLKIISVAMDGPETVAGVQPYIRSQRYSFTVVVDEDTSIAQAYNPKATAPFTVLIDRSGNVEKTIAGFQLSEAAHLEAMVKRLLARQ